MAKNAAYVEPGMVDQESGMVDQTLKAVHSTEDWEKEEGMVVLAMGRTKAREGKEVMWRWRKMGGRWQVGTGGNEECGAGRVEVAVAEKSNEGEGGTEVMVQKDENQEGKVW